MALKLHNLEAYYETKNMLMKYNECCLVAGTGVGKSNIATELINELKLNTLVIAPTNSIKDNWAAMPEDYDIPPMISTVSYQLFSTNPELFKGFDMYIFDECHHIGFKVWGTAIKTFKASLENGEYVLGLTADSIRYLDYEAEVKDVAYSVFDGHVVYGLDSKEAIELGVLPKATYICALYNAKEYIEKYENMDMSQELKGRLALTKKNCESIEVITNRHVPKDVPLKGIVFVDSIDRVKSGVDLVKSCFPGYEVDSVHSKKKNSKDILDKFKNTESGFIVSINMISEGMHFKGVNVIIMLRKTQSPSLYIQQIGRGLTSGGQNPVIFDLVRNDLSIRKALDNVDKFNESTKNINNITGERSSNNPVISDQNIVQDYVTNILSILEEIERSSREFWTENEDNILKEFYPTTGADVYKKLPGRTRQSCKNRASKLNIKVISAYDKWSEKEDEILVKNYPIMGSKVADLLPGRTKQSCIYRAMAKKLKRIHVNSKWTESEDRILKEFYPTIGADVCEKLPGRTACACKSRASKLNILYVDNKWTESEDSILKEFYPTMGLNVCEKLPGRTAYTCMNRASKLKILHENRWTKEEDNIIKTFYPSMGKSVSKKLPGRTESACIARASLLSVKSNCRYNKWRTNNGEE